MPSEASVKFFDETFFQKSFDLALDLSGRQPEKKLGKQRSVFPGRWGTKKVASRKLGSKASFCPLSRLTAPAPPRGEPSLASPFELAQVRASPFGGGAPAGGGEGNPLPPRTCAILLMSTSGSELPLARIESPGTGPRTCAILSMSTSGSELPQARIESPGTGPPGPKMGK